MLPPSSVTRPLQSPSPLLLLFSLLSLRRTLSTSASAASPLAIADSSSHASLCVSLLRRLLRRGALSAAHAVVDRLVATASSSVADAASALDYAASLGLSIDLPRLLRRLLASRQPLKAEALYARAHEGTLPDDPLLLDSMIICYSELGNLVSARTHLDHMIKIGSWPSKDAYNALLHALCAESMYLEAMDLFVLMAGGGVLPPLSAYHLLIPGLCSKGFLDKARFLFDVMLGSGLSPSARLYKSLVYGFCKAKRVLEAEHVCRVMESRGLFLDRVMCTALICGYCKEGRMELALNVFKRMKEMGGTEPDVYAYNTLINGLFRLGYVDSGWNLYNEMVDSGLEPNLVTYNIMISWYCKNNRVDCALELFDVMSRRGIAPDLRCYTLLITALCKESRSVEAEQLFDKMLANGLFPDHVMFVLLSKSFPKDHETTIVRKTLQAIAKLDHNIEYSKFSKLSGGCSNVTLQREAELLLDEIVKSNVLPIDVVFNIMIIAMCAEGRIDVSYYLLDKLVGYGCEPSVYMYNIMIRCLCRENQMDDARSLISLMQSRGVAPDLATHSIMINAYSKQGEIDLALGIFNEIIEQGFEPTVAVYDSIIGCLCRMKRVKEAEFIFRRMIEAGVLPDEVIYTTILNGYSKIRRTVDACDLFDEMVERGLQPSSHAYSALINGLIKGNKIRKACYYLDRMLEEGFMPDTELVDSELMPDLHIYNGVLNGLCRANMIEDAYDLISLMRQVGVTPNQVTYTILMNAHIRLGDTEHAIQLFNQLNSYGYSFDRFTYNTLIKGLSMDGRGICWIDLEVNVHLVLHACTMFIYSVDSSQVNLISLHSRTALRNSLKQELHTIWVILCASAIELKDNSRLSWDTVTEKFFIQGSGCK
ncbi:Pentatricopeptide repeat-containing protein [Ananas comosus]|uniref:Pentatricopeptide repeat-containing protein n=1 Tax=Ananas comosus TaxID=4615 RepID=A0A199VLN6_ANACO|nr:Pentatricopeptide repeat-containing protein [Ananas comosus]